MRAVGGSLVPSHRACRPAQSLATGYSAGSACSAITSAPGTQAPPSAFNVAGWRAWGRALMRISPASAAVVAITLIAAAAVYSDSSDTAGADRAARTVQPGLAQTDAS